MLVRRISKPVGPDPEATLVDLCETSDMLRQRQLDLRLAVMQTRLLLAELKATLRRADRYLSRRCSG